MEDLRGYVKNSFQSFNLESAGKCTSWKRGEKIKRGKNKVREEKNKRESMHLILTDSLLGWKRVAASP